MTELYKLFLTVKTRWFMEYFCFALYIFHVYTARLSKIISTKMAAKESSNGHSVYITNCKSLYSDGRHQIKLMKTFLVRMLFFLFIKNRIIPCNCNMRGFRQKLKMSSSHHRLFASVIVVSGSFFTDLLTPEVEVY